MHRGDCDPAATAFQPASCLVYPKRLRLSFPYRVPGSSIRAACTPAWGSRDMDFPAKGVHLSRSCFTPKNGWSASPG